MSFQNMFNNTFSNGLSSFGNGNNGTSGSTPWSTIANIGKNLYNGIRKKNDKNYSDVEESIMYPLQGAAAGSSLGPWGAAGGALYGLGYSFKDDIGLKDSNFLTQLLFPLDMGDGGGLRVKGKSILKL